MARKELEFVHACFGGQVVWLHSAGVHITLFKLFGFSHAFRLHVASYLTGHLDGSEFATMQLPSTKVVKIFR